MGNTAKWYTLFHRVDEDGKLAEQSEEDVWAHPDAWRIFLAYNGIPASDQMSTDKMIANIDQIDKFLKQGPAGLAGLEKQYPLMRERMTLLTEVSRLPAEKDKEVIPEAYVLRGREFLLMMMVYAVQEAIMEIAYRPGERVGGYVQRNEGGLPMVF